jgi:transposase
MIPPEQRAEIRRLFYAEHWRVGTIATTLGVHHDTVQQAIERDRFVRSGTLVRPSALDPYKAFLAATLEQYPRLRATRLHAMLRERGYLGSAVQVRRYVRTVRPAARAEAFLRLETLPGEQGQVDWGHFGGFPVGGARRVLSCFVLVLSWSRAVYARFALDQTLESFLRGHVEAFTALGGGAAHPAVRQSQERRPRARRRPHPLSSPRARAGRALSLCAAALHAVPRQ